MSTVSISAMDLTKVAYLSDFAPNSYAGHTLLNMSHNGEVSTQFRRASSVSVNLYIYQAAPSDKVQIFLDDVEVLPANTTPPITMDTFGPFVVASGLAEDDTWHTIKVKFKTQYGGYMDLTGDASFSISGASPEFRYPADYGTIYPLNSESNTNYVDHIDIGDLNPNFKVDGWKCLGQTNLFMIEFDVNMTATGSIDTFGGYFGDLPVKVSIDGGPFSADIILSTGWVWSNLVNNLTAGDHNIRVILSGSNETNLLVYALRVKNGTLLNSPKKPKYAFYGDSITFGGGAPFFSDCYAAHFARQRNISPVVRAVNGARVVGYLDDVSPILNLVDHFDKCIVLAGTNDVADIPTFKASYTAMAHALCSGKPNSTFVFCKILPRFYDSNPPVAQKNAAIVEALAAIPDTNWMLIDLSEFGGDYLLKMTTDSLHPNSRGGAFLADLIARKIVDAERAAQDHTDVIAAIDAQEPRIATNTTFGAPINHTAGTLKIIQQSGGTMTLSEARSWVRQFARNAGDSVYDDAAIDRAIMIAANMFIDGTRSTMRIDTVTAVSGSDEINLSDVPGFRTDRIKRVYLGDRPLGIWSWEELIAQQDCKGTPEAIAFEDWQTARIYPAPSADTEIKIRWFPSFSSWSVGCDDTTAQNIILNLPNDWMQQILAYGATAILQHNEPEHLYANASYQKFQEFIKSLSGAGNLGTKVSYRE